MTAKERLLLLEKRAKLKKKQEMRYTFERVIIDDRPCLKIIDHFLDNVLGSNTIDYIFQPISNTDVDGYNAQMIDMIISNLTELQNIKTFMKDFK